jgi:hypothetical protein
MNNKTLDPVRLRALHKPISRIDPNHVFENGRVVYGQDNNLPAITISHKVGDGFTRYADLTELHTIPIDCAVMIQIGRSNGSHFHFAYLTRQQADSLVSRNFGTTGDQSDAFVKSITQSVQVISSEENGHKHTLSVNYNPFTQKFFVYVETIPQGHVAYVLLQDTTVDLTGYATEEYVNEKIDSLQLVSPLINSSWTLYQNDGITPYVFGSSNISGNKNIMVDKGVIANLSSTYFYPFANVGFALPESVSGDFGTVLPDPGNDSPPIIINSITVNTKVAVQLSKPKTGLTANLVTGQVTEATGNDETSDSSSIVFSGRSYIGYSLNGLLAAAEIQTLPNNSFSSSRSRTITGVTAQAGYYTYYVYDASFGDLANVIMNGAEPILGAFRKLADVTITNNAGLQVTMRVYRSNAVMAFTNNTLSFS